MERYPARSRLVLVALLLLGVIIVNVGQFRSVDEETNARWRAFNHTGTADVWVLGHSQSPDFRDRYGLYLSLAEVAPGSRVLLPESGPFRSNEYAVRFRSLGRVSALDRAPIPSDLDEAGASGDRVVLAAAGSVAPFDPTPHIVSRGGGRKKAAPWALALAGDPPPDADLEPDRFLRQAFRNGRRGDSPGPPREFVLLRWQTPLPDSPYAYQDVLVETSLLPGVPR